MGNRLRTRSCDINRMSKPSRGLEGGGEPHPLRGVQHRVVNIPEPTPAMPHPGRTELRPGAGAPLVHGA